METIHQPRNPNTPSALRIRTVTQPGVIEEMCTWTSNICPQICGKPFTPLPSNCSLHIVSLAKSVALPRIPSNGKSTSPRIIPRTMTRKKTMLATRPLCRQERVQLDSCKNWSCVNTTSSHSNNKLSAAFLVSGVWQSIYVIAVLLSSTDWRILPVALNPLVGRRQLQTGYCC